MKESCAQVYAILTFKLVDHLLRQNHSIKKLVICNDEQFSYVRLYLQNLLAERNIQITNISDYRKMFGRKVGSLADNLANVYRRRALKPNRKGKKLNVVPVSFNDLYEKWKK